jgi:hypothetical protein
MFGVFGKLSYDNQPLAMASCTAVTRSGDITTDHASSSPTKVVIRHHEVATFERIL